MVNIVAIRIEAVKSAIFPKYILSFLRFDLALCNFSTFRFLPVLGRQHFGVEAGCMILILYWV